MGRVESHSRRKKEGYGVIGADDKTGALLNLNTVRIHGNVREGWIMLTWAQPQRKNVGKPYIRDVSKWTVDCAARTSWTGTATLYGVDGSSVDVVGSFPADPAPTESVPNSVGEAVVSGICMYKPDA
jgi:hypothetical protein